MNHASSRPRGAWAAAALCMALGGLIAAPQSSQAQPINNGDGTWTLNFGINAGDTPPAGDPWWLSALISPLAGDSGVTIDLTANLQEADEFITSVGFNLLNEIDNLSWSCSSSFITCSDTDVEQRFNDSNEINFANGVKGLDLALYLPISNSLDRFQGSDTARFTINGTGLTPLNFLTVNDPDSPVNEVYSAARVQGLSTGSGSTTIIDPDPVPGPLPLLGAGVALGLSRRLRQRLALGRAAAA